MMCSFSSGPSLDLPESEEHDLATLHHSDSRSPLNSPQGVHDGMSSSIRTFMTASPRSAYPLPTFSVNGNPPYLTPPQAAATHSPSASQRVHYPPTSYSSKKQDYTTVPLRDTSPVTQPDRGTPSPLPSGANTPIGSTNKKKYWTFLPMHSSQSLDSGIGALENEKKNKRPRSHRTGSWDLLGDKADWEDYNVAEANVENLRFAEGDVGTTKVCDCLIMDRCCHGFDNRCAVVEQVLLLGAESWYCRAVDAVHPPCSDTPLDTRNRRSHRSNQCHGMACEARTSHHADRYWLEINSFSFGGQSGLRCSGEASGLRLQRG